MEVCLCCGNTDRSLMMRSNKGIPFCVTKVCAEVTCGDNPIETIVDVDDMLVDIIIWLNKNGYKTLHSCQGHYTGDGGSFTGSRGYITIEVREIDSMNTKKVNILDLLGNSELPDGPEYKIYQDLVEAFPDSIGNFKLTYGYSPGPRNIIDHTMVLKLVLRFEMDPEVELLNKFDFMEQNLKMLSNFYISLLDLETEMKIRKEFAQGSGGPFLSFIFDTTIGWKQTMINYKDHITKGHAANEFKTEFMEQFKKDYPSGSALIDWELFMDNETMISIIAKSDFIAWNVSLPLFKLNLNIPIEAGKLEGLKGLFKSHWSSMYFIMNTSKNRLFKLGIIAGEKFEDYISFDSNQQVLNIPFRFFGRLGD